MNNMNLPPEKMNELLKMAGQKLGQDPSELKNKLENGDLNQIIGGLDAKTQNQIGALMNNPKALEAIMKNDKVKNMLTNLMGRK